jgi:hypothetical protein
MSDRQFLRAGITGTLSDWGDPEKHYFKKTGKYTLAGSPYTISYLGNSNGIGLQDMLKHTTELKGKGAAKIVLEYVLGNSFKSDYREQVDVEEILNSPTHPKQSEGIHVKLEHQDFCLNPKYLKALKYMDSKVTVEYSDGGLKPLRFKSKGKKFVIMPIRVS